MSTTASATATYAVTGMTCGCCVNKVRDKVGAIPGVTDVAVDGGTVTVAADAPIGRDEVAAAVGRAGFQLAD
ncbi:Copper chaperone CopZ [Nocardia amikacinitolerans]|uniref:heavy-metal-associated domain-containing protein n=1 Tax=Nocardia amikacinitolerans TaxID=756689 RepID=UPI0020A46316|nr:heavy metal-associated domain-containing protein [Nocardia amikacinitolerans]MCP2294775.1 Copper chaperone CopZ [Nocardia amikacinitolerans]